MKNRNGIIFCRVSSESQDYQRQLLDLEEVAHQRHVRVIKTITEKVSGTKLNEERMGVQSLIDCLKSTEVEEVLISEISRLGRNTMETLKLIETIHSFGVSIFMADLKMSTLDSNGQPNLQSEIIVHLLSLLNQEWVRQHSSRVKSGQRRAREKGIKFGRPKGLESSRDFLSKYPELVSSFRKGEVLSLRKRAKLYNVSVGTVVKVIKLMSSES